MQVNDFRAVLVRPGEAGAGLSSSSCMAVATRVCAHSIAQLAFGSEQLWLPGGQQHMTLSFAGTGM